MPSENDSVRQPAQPAGNANLAALPPARINRTALAHVRDLATADEPDPLPELIALFLEDTPGRLAQMRRAVQLHDARALDSAAHSLKGSSASLGAETMVGLCTRAMTSAAQADMSAARAIVNELELEFAAAKSLLEAELKAAPGR